MGWNVCFVVVVGYAFEVLQLVVHGWRIGTSAGVLCGSHSGAGPEPAIWCMANQLMVTWGFILRYQMVLKYFSHGLQVLGAISTASNSSKFYFGLHLWSPARTAHKIHRFCPIWAIENGLENSYWQMGRLDNLWMGAIGLKLIEIRPFLLLQLLPADGFWGAPAQLSLNPLKVLWAQPLCSTLSIRYKSNQICFWFTEIGPIHSDMAHCWNFILWHWLQPATVVAAPCAALLPFCCCCWSLYCFEICKSTTAGAFVIPIGSFCGIPYYEIVIFTTFRLLWIL